MNDMPTATIEDSTAAMKARLSANYKDMMTTDEVRANFEVLSFMAPFVMVKRKSDGVKGTLQFTHMPRFYFDFCQS